jgi:hypothetical protein
MKHCNEIDCLLHPENPHNYNVNNYSASSDGDSITGWQPIENNVLQIGDVTFNTNNSISELVLDFKNHNIKISIECLFCERRNKIDMKNEIYKRKAKSLLEE